MIWIIEGGKLAKSEKLDVLEYNNFSFVRLVTSHQNPHRYSILATQIDYEENCKKDEKVVVIVDGTGG